MDSGLTRIRFSLDAIKPETYKKVRVGSIPLKRVIKNIEDFLNLKEKGGYKLPVVGVSFCKVKENENEVDEFINFWRDKVDLVSIQKFVPPTTNKERYKHYYASDQYHEKPVEKFHCFNHIRMLLEMNLCILAV